MPFDFVKLRIAFRRNIEQGEDMYLAKVVLLAGAAVLMAGCGTRMKRSTQSMGDGQGNTLGSIFVWSNDVSAAVAYPPRHATRTEASKQEKESSLASPVSATSSSRVTTPGPICMQRALTAGATSVETSLNLSEAALALAKLPSVKQGDGSLLAATADVGRSVMALNVSTERTAYLDTGLFYLCQLAANDALTQEQFQLAVLLLIEKSATMVPVTAYISTVSAQPRPKASSQSGESPPEPSVEKPQKPIDQTSPDSGQNVPAQQAHSAAQAAKARAQSLVDATIEQTSHSNRTAETARP